MESLKNIAIEVLGRNEKRMCSCGGGHEVCLRCSVCRVKEEDKLALDFEHLAQYIDHTLLKPEATSEEIITLCEEADYYKTKSVCVNPIYVDLAHKNLKEALTCTVVGFPLSNSLTSTIVQEASTAIAQGATEVDMVLKVGWLKDKEYQKILTEISIIAQTCHANGAILKVILENCLLTDEEIVVAAILAKKAGVDFIKTSTGFNKSGAELKDVELMRKVMGPKFGIKAAGGIRDRKTAIAMLKTGANRIGASATKAILKEEHES